VAGQVAVETERLFDLGEDTAEMLADNAEAEDLDPRNG